MSIESLSPREREVLTYIGRGMGAKAIARTMNLGVGTVGDHTKRVFAKLGVQSRVRAAVLACKAGLV